MPKRKIPSVKFPKLLTTPIEVEPIENKIALVSGTGLSIEDQRKPLEEKRNKYIKNELDKRVLALYNFYKIDPNQKLRVELLLYMVLRDQFDGFKVVIKNKAGTKNKWDGKNHFLLCCDVDNLVKSKKVSARQACKILIQNKSKPWRNLLKTSKTENIHEQLYRRYYKGKQDPFVMGMEVFLRALPRPEMKKIIDQLYKDWTSND